MSTVSARPPKAAPLTPGDPAPMFRARTSSNPRYDFSSVAGRVVVLCCIKSAGPHTADTLLKELWARTDLFDDEGAALFVATADPDDERLPRLTPKLPGYRIFWDFDERVARAYGCAPDRATPRSIVLDRDLRVVAVVDAPDPHAHAELLVAAVGGAADRNSAEPSTAPVLVVRRLFEPAFCQELIAAYEKHGGRDSGFMRDDPASGNTIGIIDHMHKRRRDHTIESEDLCTAIRERIERRLLPEIAKAFQFRATRIERYIVACYDAHEGGYFRPHRDNTTRGTAHRRFAITINLNAEEYDGGDLRFPEFGSRTYRAPTGGAVVFSCSLLHEATPITRGRRYCVLPFLYDETGARQREISKKYLVSPGTSDPDQAPPVG